MIVIGNMEELDKRFEKYKEPLINLCKRHGIGYNLDNPVTIQDKLNWMKIYDSTPLKTRCADKIQLHDYCKEKLGVDLCIPIIKTYDKVGDINWDELPNQFVIKCNHGSGMNIIVKDKSTLNIADAERRLQGFMNDDFAFHVGYEMHYHDIPHRIFAEEYMSDEGQKQSLYDYKFWCFNGEPKFYTINTGNGHGNILYYWMNGEPFDPYGLFNNKNPFKQPKTFDKMVAYAKVLSEPFMFVRVDFYEINERTYLGELTFEPGAALFKYKNPEYNKIMGDMLEIKHS